MDKPWLLIAGDHYYPSGGTSDWIDRFETQQEAKDEITAIPQKLEYRFTRGKNKGKIKEIKEWKTYKIRGREYDWHEIVNLEEWKPDL